MDNRFPQNTYQESYRGFVLGKVREKDIQEPIFASEVSRDLAAAYGLDESKAKAATAVAFKRIFDDGDDTSLRRYGRGIYYRTEATPFGEYGIDRKALIRHRYLDDGIGYETGYKTLHRMGLTTQMPSGTEIATNRAKERRLDRELGVVVRPPKTKVSKDNLLYLKLLDAMSLMDKAPIDAEDPYGVLAGYMKENGLDFVRLLGLASRHYGQDVLDKIAKTAGRMME